MARKTKKEKIIAEFRRKMTSSMPLSAPLSAHQEKPEEVTPKLLQTDSLYVYPVQLIRKDLTKTLLLSILAISLELALFLVLEKHLVLPFRVNF